MAWKALSCNGKIEPKEKQELPEGSKALVTFSSEDENQFWIKASQLSSDEVWDNKEDDVYEELL